MSWTLLFGLLLALALAVAVLSFRRAERARLEEHLAELERSRQHGTRKASLRYPHVDLSRCLGCGACVRACPEEGVLSMIHGQALVVHGARCVGHGLCASECPTGAITLAFADLEQRRDLPVVDARFEAPGVPGLFLGGEVTGFALVRAAIEHGTAIADEVMRRVRSERCGGDARVLDLCIVGAGPAGLAASLRAKQHGLRFLALEQESIGGTVARYPRRKLVMTQPVELPLHGKLDQRTYPKEELVALWESIVAEHELPIRTGVHFLGLTRLGDGTFSVDTDQGALRARHVALMLGRRGTPRKLGVPGEELSKVAYSLIDAASYQDRRVLVVGGGDSAVEAALALAEQPGNEVTLSYRRAVFSRLKAANEQRLEEARAAGRLHVLLASEVQRIGEEHVDLALEDARGKRSGRLANDEVFVMAGGIPPFELLRACGISFDPAQRTPAPALREEGTGLLRALAIALALVLIALGWIGRHADYYLLAPALRPLDAAHEWLRPSGALGLALGIVAAGLILVNLGYLLRRHTVPGFTYGSLRAWMTGHVATGVLALLFALLHGAMATHATLGSRALVTLAVVVASGGLGRYLYSFVPRAANGRELELDELSGELAQLSAEWDRENRDFGEHVRAAVQALVSRTDGQRTIASRIAALLGASRRLRATLSGLSSEGEALGIPPDQIERLMALARRAHRAASLAAHYEDLRSVVGSWRWLHRWAALFLVLVLALHVVVALRYGGVLD